MRGWSSAVLGAGAARMVAGQPSGSGHGGRVFKCGTQALPAARWMTASRRLSFLAATHSFNTACFFRLTVYILFLLDVLNTHTRLDFLNTCLDLLNANPHTRVTCRHLHSSLECRPSLLWCEYLSLPCCCCYAHPFPPIPSPRLLLLRACRVCRPVPSLSRVCLLACLLALFSYRCWQ